ncbi:MAG: glutamate-cysteine ligase family protein [Bdellovibrionota bacterium]
MSSIVESLFAGISPKRGQKLGAEVERLGLDSKAQILSYSQHIEPLFQELISKKNWNPSARGEGGRILALSRGDDAITLEPGAQVEIAPRPCDNLSELMEVEAQIGSELLSTEVAKNWTWLWWAVNPKKKAEEVELIPSKRYQIMTDYFPKVGRRGRDMMRLTTGSHLNLDFFSKKEAIDMLQASCALFPVVGGLFAHSPYYQGKLSGFLSVRQQIWKDTDPLRSGFPNEFLSDDFNIQNYVNLVESTPLMFFQDENSDYQAADGRCLKDLSLELQKRNALSAMRQLFFDVRLKPCCVEFRALDQQTPEFRGAAFALIVGILYDEENRSFAIEQAKTWGAEKIKQLQDEASKTGLKSDEIFSAARTFYDRALKGLERRARNEMRCLFAIQKLLQLRLSSGELELSEQKESEKDRLKKEGS